MTEAPAITPGPVRAGGSPALTETLKGNHMTTHAAACGTLDAEPDPAWPIYDRSGRRCTGTARSRPGGPTDLSDEQAAGRYPLTGRCACARPIVTTSGTAGWIHADGPYGDWVGSQFPGLLFPARKQPGDPVPLAGAERWPS